MKKSDRQTATTIRRPLEGRCIGISISESADLASLGLGNEIVNGLTVDLARRLIGLGASVVLGHNWRTGGIMEAVARFALSYKSQSGSIEQSLIFNYLAFPDEPSLSDSDKEQLQLKVFPEPSAERQTFSPGDFVPSVSTESLVSIETIGWRAYAPDIRRAFDQGPEFGQNSKRMIMNLAKSSLQDRQRELDLTAMRFKLAQKCDTRLVIGGKTHGYQGFAPGVIEEAWWTIFSGKKLVVCSGMGGAARAIVDSQAQKVMGDDSHPLAQAYLNDLHSTAFSQVSDLSVEAILMNLVR
jgi:SLOG cluster2